MISEKLAEEYNFRKRSKTPSYVITYKVYDMEEQKYYLLKANSEAQARRKFFKKNDRENSVILKVEKVKKL